MNVLVLLKKHGLGLVGLTMFLGVLISAILDGFEISVATGWLRVLFCVSIFAVALVCVLEWYPQNKNVFEFRGLRFHLSTAVIMVLVAGTLIHLNLAPGEVREPCNFGRFTTFQTYGWPLVAARTGSDAVYLRENPALQWRGLAIVGNTLAGIFLLVGSALYCEWRARQHPFSTDPLRLGTLAHALASLHLGTLIIVAALTTVFVLLNTQPIPRLVSSETAESYDWTDSYTEATECGWPLRASCTFFRPPNVSATRRHTPSLLLNVAVATCSIVLIGTTTELLLRWMDRRRG